MSPRGVTIPQAREQLFQAAERVLSRDGPDGLTSRAITDEAGVAKGLLHNHFGDLDRFLAELVLDRAHAATDRAAALTTKVGTGTVMGNLTDAATALLGSRAFAIVGIVHARPAILARLHATGGHRPSSALDEVEHAFAAYLAGERQIGRIDHDADTETLALILVGALHHLFMTGRVDGTTARSRIERVVAVAVG